MKNIFAIPLLILAGCLLPGCKSIFHKAPVNALLPGPESKLVRFEQIGETETGRAVLVLNVVDDHRKESVVGATAVLQNIDKPKVYGMLTQDNGGCTFNVTPGHYTLRIQNTGSSTFEKLNLELGDAKQYYIEVELGTN